MKRHRFPVFLAAVFAAKLAALLQLQDHPLLRADAGLDTAVYTRLAGEVVSGNPWLTPGLYFVSPLYVYFLALILAAARSFEAARVVQIVLGTAAVGWIYVAAREWFGVRAAWLAALLAALTGLFTFYEVLLLQAALDPFLTSAALASLSLALRSGSATGGMRHAQHWFAICGFVFGLQTLNRPNVLVPAIAIAGLLALSRRLKPAALLAAGLAVALLPAAIRNYAVAGDWSPASSHGGLNFYIGNNPEADGTYHLVPGITPNIEGQQTDARRVAEAAVGRPLDDAEVSAHFYGRGWSWIRQHPGDALRLFVRKIQFVFNAGFISLNYSYPFYAYDERTVLALLFVGPWLLIPAGLVGLALGLARAPRRDYLIWSSFVPLYALSVALFFVSERYRLPLLAPMCIGAAAAIDRMAVAARARRLRSAAAVLAAMLLLGVLTNWPTGLDDGRAEERTRMAERMVVDGRFDAAERWAAAAERLHPRPGLVHFRLGRLLIGHRKPDVAIAHLERALALDPNRAEINYALGQALVDAGRPRDAVPHLEKALAAGVRVDLAGFDLARARLALGDRAGALQVLQAVRPENPSDAQSWQILGQLALELESTPLAAAFLAEAVTAAPRAPKLRQDLGLALAMMGRYPEAIAEFEQSVALDAADPAAQLNLAVAYAEVGRIADARAHAQEALRLKPDFERARQFLGVLK